MITRDLSDKERKQLALECDHEYAEWIRLTEGLSIRTQTPIPQKELWRLAFSKGVSALLRRVDKLKEQP